MWLPIKDYEGLYEVSDDGQIKSLYRKVKSGKCNREWKEQLLKVANDKDGYLRTNLAKNGKNKTVKVHRIVAQTFISNPNNYAEVNHIDGNKQNNSIENLEWVNRSQNLKHAYKNKLKRLDCENNSASKLTLKDVEYIRANYIPNSKQFGCVALGKRFNVHFKTISRIVNNKTWCKGGVINYE